MQPKKIKLKIIMASVIILTFYFSFKQVLQQDEIFIDDKNALIKEHSAVEMCDEYNNKKQTVIELSKLLNKAMNRIGKQSCKLSVNQISTNGGWCAEISGKNSSQHLTDPMFAAQMSKFLKGKRVASFGDGPGGYKELLTKLNEVIVYDAFDGAPYCEEITNGNVKFLDLSVPIYHLSKYDWIVSVEVAEHIPKEFEQIYIDNLVRHANEGIIISWAVEGQDGLSHINNRNFDYVKIQMEKRGFFHDEASSTSFKMNASLVWLKRNLNVFRFLK